MMAESRHFVTLDEIIGLEYTCSKCGVRVLVPRSKDKWKTVPCSCPGGCITDRGGAESWFDPNSEDYERVQMLVNSINGLIAARANEIGCSLRIEVRDSEDK